MLETLVRTHRETGNKLSAQLWAMHCQRARQSSVPRYSLDELGYAMTSATPESETQLLAQLGNGLSSGGTVHNRKPLDELYTELNQIKVLRGGQIVVYTGKADRELYLIKLLQNGDRQTEAVKRAFEDWYRQDAKLNPSTSGSVTTCTEGWYYTQPQSAAPSFLSDFAKDKRYQPGFWGLPQRTRWLLLSLSEFVEACSGQSVSPSWDAGSLLCHQRDAEHYNIVALAFQDAKSSRDAMVSAASQLVSELFGKKASQLFHQFCS